MKKGVLLLSLLAFTTHAMHDEEVAQPPAEMPTQHDATPDTTYSKACMLFCSKLGSRVKKCAQKAGCDSHVIKDSTSLALYGLVCCAIGLLIGGKIVHDACSE